MGGIIGAGIEAIKAEASGERITAGSVAGAFVAGGIAGVGVVNVPETGGASIVIAGATNGAIAAGAGDATKQAVDIATGDQKNFSSRELAVNTAVGAVVGGGG